LCCASASKSAGGKRDKIATLGIVLQMCAYFLAFFQPPWQPSCRGCGTVGHPWDVFAVLTVAIAAGSAWLIETQSHAGKQWHGSGRDMSKDPT